jgi:hypothetical protein
MASHPDSHQWLTWRVNRPVPEFSTFGKRRRYIAVDGIPPVKRGSRAILNRRTDLARVEAGNAARDGRFTDGENMKTGPPTFSEKRDVHPVPRETGHS